MNVFMTGSKGLIGRHLVPILERAGHAVTRLVRDVPNGPNERCWESAGHPLCLSTLKGCDVLIHLAGEPLTALRWSRRKKDEIYASRVNSTGILAEAVRKMPNPPHTMIVASAVGYYGDSGDRLLTEASPSGEGFLASVCREWERACAPAIGHTRIVNVRTGLVLSKDGGALKAMLTPFRLGLGGTIGSGEQYWSWISLDDHVRLISHIVHDDSISGPVNAVSPHPVTNQEFTRALGKALNRPTFLPVPTPLVKLVTGEMGNELLLSSARVVPEVALSHRFSFNHSEINFGLHAFLAPSPATYPQTEVQFATNNQLRHEAR
ncbi:TIGR01777 family oxidoreductase [Planctomicrobium sp. SH668]|uniref:TIGR01777 family oxidoreductase n=1 Tax=Planctomicrobium sp. SH668 TaxID=3448126 RepID=UPI003F5C65AE